jgi:membrane-bound inhibitor of C-type lysozyme
MLCGSEMTGRVCRWLRSGLYLNGRGTNRNRYKTGIFEAVLCVAAVVASASAVSAQTTFQSYLCADRTRFITAFYPYDLRAHLQIDGREATLTQRLTWSGTRYSGDGIVLRMTKAGITVKYARRPTTACEPVN